MVKNAVVVGFPRSGTSLTSAVFARQGYYVGGAKREAIVRGDDYNPFGYFEADDVIERNVELFRRVDYVHHNTWLFDPITAAAMDRIAELTPTDEDRQLLDAYQQRGPWMWKDCRLCMTLGYWAKLIDWNTTGVVLILRDPEDTYHSFCNRGWCRPGAASRKDVLARVEQHRSAALATVERLGLPHVLIDYDDYKKRPERVADVLGKFFGIALQASDLNFRRELDHSSLRGRLASRGRHLLRQIPRPLIHQIERFVPRRLVALLFPERKYISSPQDTPERG